MFNLHTAKQYHIYYLMRGEFKLIFLQNGTLNTNVLTSSLQIHYHYHTYWLI
jgi:hypothetical protein